MQQKHQIPIIKTPVWDISAVFDITALTEVGFYNLPESELVEKTCPPVADRP